VNIHTLDPGARFLRAKLGPYVAFLRCAQKEADGVEQKRARAAGGIENMLDQRSVDDMLDHLRREPIGV
jgi:hypothetical protein